MVLSVVARHGRMVTAGVGGIKPVIGGPFGPPWSGQRRRKPSLANVHSLRDNRPYQTQHLDDLAQSGDLDDLIDAAIRYQKSSFEEVRIAASRHLASALLQSEDLASRQKGLACAFQHLDQSWASSVDYCIAAAAAESFGEYKRAESTVLEALGHWPEDPQLREYCRNLVTQTGSQNLRQRLDETGVNGQ